MQHRPLSPDETDHALRSCRERLDACDARLQECVRDRFAIIAEVAAIKRDENIPVMQGDRVNAVVGRARRFAADHGLSPDALEAIYRVLIAEACRVETLIIESNARKPEPSSLLE